VCAVLSKNDVIHLQDAAEWLLHDFSGKRYYECNYLYRNKAKKYFDKIYSSCDGIMETYLKDASGDERSPINGEICGLFFCTSVMDNGEPFEKSPFGDTRLLIHAEEVLKLTPNMFFADFYCMQFGERSTKHHVTIVLTKTGSRADQFCNRCLPRLDLEANPFLYKDAGDRIFVSSASALFVDVFVTEDINVMEMEKRGIAYMRRTGVCGSGTTSQGGKLGVKAANCNKCNLFPSSLQAHELWGDELY